MLRNWNRVEWFERDDANSAQIVSYPILNFETICFAEYLYRVSISYIVKNNCTTKRTVISTPSDDIIATGYVVRGENHHGNSLIDAHA